MTTFTTEDRIIAEKDCSVTINVEPIPFAGMVTLTESAPIKRKDLWKEGKTGLFSNIQIDNPTRDKAWEAFIKRKDVEGWAVDKEGFPLNGFYDVWCIAWSKGWDDGYGKAQQ